MTSLSPADRSVGLEIGKQKMRYQHSLEIYERIEEVLRLIKTGRYSPPAVAEKIGVSIPTISRIVAALRELGTTYTRNAPEVAGGMCLLQNKHIEVKKNTPKKKSVLVMSSAHDH